MPQWRKLHTKSLDSLDINDMPDDFCRVLWLMLPLALAAWALWLAAWAVRVLGVLQ